MKRSHGFLSYIVAASKTILLYYLAPLVCIECDEQTITMYTFIGLDHEWVPYKGVV